MDAGVLEQYLRDGLSLEKIGELAGRHPTTVGYWVKQHGLAAVHRDRHAPKGGIDHDTLAALVDAGLSTREITERLGLSNPQSGTGSAGTTFRPAAPEGGKPTGFRAWMSRVSRTGALDMASPSSGWMPEGSIAVCDAVLKLSADAVGG
jgi:hypothetical protein